MSYYRYQFSNFFILVFYDIKGVWWGFKGCLGNQNGVFVLGVMLILSRYRFYLLEIYFGDLLAEEEGDMVGNSAEKSS